MTPDPQPVYSWPTVGDLIEQLEKLPRDTILLVEFSNGELYGAPTVHEDMKVRFDPFYGVAAPICHRSKGSEKQVEALVINTTDFTMTNEDEVYGKAEKA